MCLAVLIRSIFVSGYILFLMRGDGGDGDKLDGKKYMCGVCLIFFSFVN